MRVLSGPLRRAIAAAATLTGRRFGLLVASSLVATAAIVAAAMSDGHDTGPLAALLGHSLAADTAPAPAVPGPSVAATPQPAAASSTPSPSAAAPEPLPEPASLPAPEAAPEPASEPETAPAPPPAPTPKPPEAGQIKHVFIVSLASPGYEASFGTASQMPYLSGTLRPKGDLLTTYSLLGDGAPANAIAVISGQPPNPQTEAGCSTYAEFKSAQVDKQGVVSGGGCVYPLEAETIADELAVGKFSWHAYLGAMADPTTGQPANCVHPEPGAAEEPPSGGYTARLNPFVYFHTLLDLGACGEDDVPLTQLEKDLRKPSSTSSYSYIAPDLCEAGVPGQCPAGAPEGAAAADAFLAAEVPKILASPAYKKDGLLIVSFGELDPPPAPATEPGAAPVPAPAESSKVGALLVSPFVTPGSTDGVAYNPYSLLKSTEDLFGLPYLARAKSTKVRSFGMSLRGSANGGD